MTKRETALAGLAVYATMARLTVEFSEETGAFVLRGDNDESWEFQTPIEAASFACGYAMGANQ